jgi:hypothetical protein
MEGQAPYLPETIAQASGIHFEPGTHPSTESDAVAIYNEFSQGNLDAHGWNTEVGERIASYAYMAPALLLTIDGLSPVPLLTPCLHRFKKPVSSGRTCQHAQIN